ncbi:hypothetical protein [Nonomuraea sp. NPDC050783]|uniref:hypothetical protein n=1 Tax=Nonomuraea sp. NPDC050783 TaxID=3154634 RepID=UPI0034661B9E
MHAVPGGLPDADERLLHGTITHRHGDCSTGPHGTASRRTPPTGPTPRTARPTAPGPGWRPCSRGTTARGTGCGPGRRYSGRCSRRPPNGMASSLSGRTTLFDRPSPLGRSPESRPPRHRDDGRKARSA